LLDLFYLGELPSLLRSSDVKYFALLSFLALASCATGYQPESISGGFSDHMTAPDEAVITYHGNDYTSAERVITLTFLRCADVTLEHGYRYFIGVSMVDLSSNSPFAPSGSASITDNATEYGNYAAINATPSVAPSQSLRIYKPAVSIRIKMSNDENSLLPLGGVIGGEQARPQDANILSRSLRQSLGIH
jgi:hypothetical protein